MKIIYEPKGKALEYAPLACNLYKGCPHGCRYCFGPTLPNPAKKGLTMEEWRREWHSKTVEKPDSLAKLESDLSAMANKRDTRPVLLCFACDPYPPDEPKKITRAALAAFEHHGFKPIILTKGGTRACRDFDILKAAGGWFGQTCSFIFDTQYGAGTQECRKAWEPNAASMMDRHNAAEIADAYGIPVWWSVEPVIDKDQALAFLTVQSEHEVSKSDHFKLGKLSGYDKETKAIEKSINWPEYREAAREILAGAGYTEIFEPGVFEVGTHYVKKELRDAK